LRIRARAAVASRGRDAGQNHEEDRHQ